MRVDYIIVGQGLAGTLLTHRLLQEKFRVFVYDRPESSSASRIASGIMNPITGRRFVKSWMFDKIMPSAIETYRDLEQLLDAKFLYRRNIIRSIQGAGNLNDWLARSVQKEYAPYIVDEANRGSSLRSDFHSMGNLIETTGSFQLDMPNLVNRYRNWLVARKSYQPGKFRHRKLQLNSSSINYLGVSARAIIFCEGSGLDENPFFKGNLLNPSIGERLVIQCDNLKLDRMLKRRHFLAPIGQGKYWYGAETHWNFDVPLPSKHALSKLSKGLEAILKIPYKQIDHRAAIRPTVRDRRPILGKHPLHPLYVFNGLGTKGASLAPYWSKVMLSYLEDQGTIPPEVNIRRFF